MTVPYPGGCCGYRATDCRSDIIEPQLHLRSHHLDIGDSFAEPVDGERTRSPILAHSHLVIRHLVKGLEARGRENLEIPLPDAISAFVDQVADLFEPFSGEARVGYECAFEDDSWEISMYLGAREIVGGPLDGRQEPHNFRFNLQGLFDQFQSIQSFLWNAMPHSPLMEPGLSFVVVEGTVAGQMVRLQLHPTAPDEAGPAMREYADGSIELAD